MSPGGLGVKLTGVAYIGPGKTGLNWLSISENEHQQWLVPNVSIIALSTLWVNPYESEFPVYG